MERGSGYDLVQLLTRSSHDSVKLGCSHALHLRYMLEPALSVGLKARELLFERVSRQSAGAYRMLDRSLCH